MYKKGKLQLPYEQYVVATCNMRVKQKKSMYLRLVSLHTDGLFVAFLRIKSKSHFLFAFLQFANRFI